MSTNEELIGREGINDLEAILAVTNTDRDEVIHAVKDNADAIFTWDYEKGKRPALNKLYEKAKNAQWNGETDLDWSIEVDQEFGIPADGLGSVAVTVRVLDAEWGELQTSQGGREILTREAQRLHPADLVAAQQREEIVAVLHRQPVAAQPLDIDLGVRPIRRRRLGRRHRDGLWVGIGPVRDQRRLPVRHQQWRHQRN